MEDQGGGGGESKETGRQRERLTERCRGRGEAFGGFLLSPLSYYLPILLGEQFPLFYGCIMKGQDLGSWICDSFYSLSHLLVSLSTIYNIAVQWDAQYILNSTSLYSNISHMKFLFLKSKSL